MLAQNGEGSQLLLLTMPQFVAGFGFMSRDLKSNYGRLYGAFKQEYAEHRNEWDELDLAFVLCVREGVAGLQAFGSSVETDVYFCRKYVVPMNGHVETSLARLPFLPLFTERGAAMRPPSAQTFLQDSGVPPVLARYVVKKGERSARSIFDECVGGTIGEPRTHLKESAAGGSGAVAMETAKIRVRSVSIEGFRAYRRRKGTVIWGGSDDPCTGQMDSGRPRSLMRSTSLSRGILVVFKQDRKNASGRVAAHLDSTNGGRRGCSCSGNRWRYAPFGAARDGSQESGVGWRSAWIARRR